jgi:hypothetical protein
VKSGRKKFASLSAIARCAAVEVNGVEITAGSPFGLEIRPIRPICPVGPPCPFLRKWESGGLGKACFGGRTALKKHGQTHLNTPKHT